MVEGCILPLMIRCSEEEVEKGYVGTLKLQEELDTTQYIQAIHAEGLADSRALDIEVLAAHHTTHLEDLGAAISSRD